MDWMRITLRLVHILGGVLWVGGAVTTTAFVMPTVKALGPEGGKFFQHLANKARLSASLMVAGILTTLTGLLLLGPATNGFSLDAMTQFGRAMTLTAGSILGVIALVNGGLIGRGSGRMAALGKEAASSGGPPAPEKLAEIQKIQAQIGRLGQINLVLLVLSLASMAIADFVY